MDKSFVEIENKALLPNAVWGRSTQQVIPGTCLQWRWQNKTELIDTEIDHRIGGLLPTYQYI